MDNNNKQQQQQQQQPNNNMKPSYLDSSSRASSAPNIMEIPINSDEAQTTLIASLSRHGDEAIGGNNNDNNTIENYNNNNIINRSKATSDGSVVVTTQVPPPPPPSTPHQQPPRTIHTTMTNNNNKKLSPKKLSKEIPFIPAAQEFLPSDDEHEHDDDDEDMMDIRSTATTPTGNKTISHNQNNQFLHYSNSTDETVITGTQSAEKPSLLRTSNNNYNTNNTNTSKSNAAANNNSQTQQSSSQTTLLLNKPYKLQDRVKSCSTRRIRLGICAMDKKARSKPMAEILSRLDAKLFHVIFFGDDMILNQNIGTWPKTDVLIAFYSSGYPLEKVKTYVQLNKPFVLNDLNMQQVLKDRRKVYDILEASGIDVAKHVYLSRDGYKSTGSGDGNGCQEQEVTEHDDYIELNGIQITKPFVEKPVDADDHNIIIYYPTSAGGGCKKLFRKIGDRSSQFYPNINEVRRDGSYIYEEFVETQGTDVKMYTVGPEYGHAEARKSPTVDGKVQRDADGKEVRFPVILSFREKEIARRIVLAFKQWVCGFDLLRVQEGDDNNLVSYVCDVNGWSFVKTSRKYYDDCAQILTEHMLAAVKPKSLHHLSTVQPLMISTTTGTGTTGSTSSNNLASNLTTYTAGEDDGRLAAMAKELGLAKQRERRQHGRSIDETKLSSMLSKEQQQHHRQQQRNSSSFDETEQLSHHEHHHGLNHHLHHGDHSDHSSRSTTEKQQAPTSLVEGAIPVRDMPNMLVQAPPAMTPISSSYANSLPSNSTSRRPSENSLDSLSEKSYERRSNSGLNNNNDNSNSNHTSTTTTTRHDVGMTAGPYPATGTGGTSDDTVGSNDNYDLHQEELRCVIAVIRHGDRTPKQKIKRNTTHPLILEYFHNHTKDPKKDLKIKEKKPMIEFLNTIKTIIGQMEQQKSIKNKKLYHEVVHMRDVLERWQIGGINRKLQLKPKKWNEEEIEIDDVEDNDDEDVINNEGGEKGEEEKKVVVNKKKKIIYKCIEVQTILKWGGNLTKLGEKQSIQLGQRIRQEMYPDAPGGGILRLHSTFRHDLKIKTSDEGRVMKTAAAFAKGLLELEGEIPPILVSLVHKEKDSVRMLDPSGNKEVKEELDQCKKNIDINLQKDFRFVQTSTKFHESIVGPSHITSLHSALRKVDNPRQTLFKIYHLVGHLINQLELMLCPYDGNDIVDGDNNNAVDANAIIDAATTAAAASEGSNNTTNTAAATATNNINNDDPHFEKATTTSDATITSHTNVNDVAATSSTPTKRESDSTGLSWAPLYKGETLLELTERWRFIYDRLYDEEKDTFDLSRIPDVHDNVRFDMLHNPHLGLKNTLEELYELAKLMADCVVPQEYGTTIEEKKSIGGKMSRKLLEKIKHDLINATPDNQVDMRYMINMDYSADLPITTMGRRIRTRLYFTSESHLHTMLNVLRFGNSDGTTSILSEDGQRILNETPEFCYLTTIVLRLFEDPRKDDDDPTRFRVEILFSPGATATPMHMSELKRHMDATRFETSPLQMISKNGLTIEEVQKAFDESIKDGTCEGDSDADNETNK